jgi:hypothetical protein
MYDRDTYLHGKHRGGRFLKDPRCVAGLPYDIPPGWVYDKTARAHAGPQNTIRSDPAVIIKDIYRRVRFSTPLSIQLFRRLSDSIIP